MSDQEVERLYCSECFSDNVRANVGHGNPNEGPMEFKSFCKSCGTFKELKFGIPPSLSTPNKKSEVEEAIKIIRAEPGYNEMLQNLALGEVVSDTDNVYVDGFGEVRSTLRRCSQGAEDYIGRKIKIHNAGYIFLVDYMGDDETVAQRARNSYTKGTKQVSDTKALVRYMMRHKHTSPFEMCELVFHIKVPLFICQQILRHRTSSINQQSARYSVLESDFYIPEPKLLCLQATTNKQGRDEELQVLDSQFVLKTIEETGIYCYEVYEQLLNDHGLTRELARSVLPANIYTTLSWKMDLHNLLHFLRLRLDKHAQKEIRDYAEAMATVVRSAFPLSWEAFEDYVLKSVTFTNHELKALAKLINEELVPEFEGLGKREQAEFQSKLEILREANKNELGHD